MERNEVIKVLESKGYKMNESEVKYPSGNVVKSFGLVCNNTFVLYSDNIGEYKVKDLKDLQIAVSYTFAGSFTRYDISNIYFDEIILSNAPDDRRFDIIQKKGYIVKIFYNQEKEVYKVSYRKNPKTKELQF